MKIKIELAAHKKVFLPKGFNYYLQSLVYNFLDRVDSTWLHEYGFKYEKRAFKMFTFSSLMEKGQFLKKENLFVFPQQISFYISSPVDWIIEQLSKNLTLSKQVKLGDNRMQISSVFLKKQRKIIENSIKINALTPIETHSTFIKSDGKKITHYYTPFEDGFGQLVNENLRKKWTALYNRKCPFSIFLKPLFKGNRNERIYFFGTEEKRTLIKGWKGHFRADGESEFLQFALEAGLGSRNSNGFGMVEIVEEK